MGLYDYNKDMYKYVRIAQFRHSNQSALLKVVSSPDCPSIQIDNINLDDDLVVFDDSGPSVDPSIAAAEMKMEEIRLKKYDGSTENVVVFCVDNLDDSFSLLVTEGAKKYNYYLSTEEPADLRQVLWG